MRSKESSLQQEFKLRNLRRKLYSTLDDTQYPTACIIFTNLDLPRYHLISSKKTAIFVIDSLGLSHTPVRNVLRDYLLNEAFDKKHILEMESKEMTTYVGERIGCKQAKVCEDLAWGTSTL